MPRLGRCCLVWGLWLCAGCVRQPLPEPGPAREEQADDIVRLTTADGATIHGRWARPEGEPQPFQVLLVPMLGRTGGDYDAFSARLAARGYASLAIDLRGHGQSAPPAGAPGSYRAFTPDDWRAAAADLVAARAAMAPRPVVVGASIGANLALLDAARHPDEVRGVVALSPGDEYHGVALEPAVNDLAPPVLVAAASGDSYSFATLDKLAARHPTWTFLRGEGKAHGTELLGGADELELRLLEWLDGLAR